MWNPFQWFAEYVAKQQVMPSRSKKRIKQQVLETYSSVRLSHQKAQGRSMFFTFFPWPMTTTRLAMYALSIFALTTGAYAAVAPKSFARLSASVQTSVWAMIENGLEAVWIKTTMDANIDAKADQENWVKSNVDTEVDAKVGTDDEKQSDRWAQQQWVLIDGQVELKGWVEMNDILSDTVGSLGIDGKQEVQIIGTASWSLVWTTAVETEVLIDTMLEWMIDEVIDIDAQWDADLSTKTLVAPSKDEKNTQEVKGDAMLKNTLGAGL